MVDSAKACVRNMYREQMSEETVVLMNQTAADLYHGPLWVESNDNGHPYPGFEIAIDRLQTFANDLPNQVWIDLCGDCVMDTDPSDSGYTDTDDDGQEFYVPFSMEDIRHYTRRDILNAVFGSEIAYYLS